jgi:hypothetical protein
MGTANNAPHTTTYFYNAPDSIRMEHTSGEIAIAETGKLLILFSDEKRAELNLDQANKCLTIDPDNGAFMLVDADPDGMTDLVRLLLDLKDDALAGELLPKREIDGHFAIGYRFQEDADTATIGWVDVETTLPIRVERSSQRVQRVYHNIEFGVELEIHCSVSLLLRDTR